MLETMTTLLLGLTARYWVYLLIGSGLALGATVMWYFWGDGKQPISYVYRAKRALQHYEQVNNDLLSYLKTIRELIAIRAQYQKNDNTIAVWSDYKKKILGKFVQFLKIRLESCGIEGVDSELLANLLTETTLESKENFRINVEKMLNSVNQKDKELTVELRLKLTKLNQQRVVKTSQQPSMYIQRREQLHGLLYERIDTGLNWFDLLKRMLATLGECLGEISAQWASGGLMGWFGASENAISMAKGAAASNSMNKIWISLRQYFSDPILAENMHLKQIHERLQQEGSDDVKLLPKAVRLKIDDIDNQIDQFLQQQQHDKIRSLLFLRQGPLMSFPIKVTVLAPTSLVADNKSQLKRIDMAIENLLEDYAHAPVEDLKYIIQSIRDNSRLQSPQQRIQIFIVGEPGVGKTYLVERLNAALGMPLSKVVLSKPEDLNAFLPSDLSIDQTADDQKLMTVIPFIQMQVGCINPIVYCDEAGEIMNFAKPEPGIPIDPISAGALSTLKFFFNVSNKEIPLRNIADDLVADFSHTTVIFSGHVIPKDQAILSGLHILQLPAIPLEKKKKIAEKTILEAAYSAASLEPNQNQQIAEKSINYLDLILECDKISGEAGVHTLKTATINLVAIIRCNVLHNEPINAKAIEQRIQAIYRKNS